MKIKNYLIDHLVHILIGIGSILTIDIILFLFQSTTTLIIFITIVCLLGIILIFIYDYYRKKFFYQNLHLKLANLKEKFLITEMIEEPDFIEGQILYDSLVDTTKSMNDEVQHHIRISNEFKQYIETWVHEIKLPIQALKLIIHNRSDDQYRRLNEQITKIDGYVEQVLYYIRSEVSQNDFIIARYSLKEIVLAAIQENRDTLILNHFTLKVEMEDIMVLTDEKWLIFILGQIMSNSVKYAKERKRQLLFYISNQCEKVTLIIEDNGLGIDAGDLPRVFDKSFTGKNGHEHFSSTGMGLYLCKQLCQELGHSIEIKSKKNEYTKVMITIQKG